MLLAPGLSRGSFDKRIRGLLLAPGLLRVSYTKMVRGLPMETKHAMMIQVLRLAPGLV
jgi:hypothetical protein